MLLKSLKTFSTNPFLLLLLLFFMLNSFLNFLNIIYRFF